MNTTTIQKWGNSYAVRLPKISMRRLNLQAGNSVEIRESAHSRTLSIVPVLKRTVSLDEMIARISKKNQHGEIEWGGAIGKEIW